MAKEKTTDQLEQLLMEHNETGGHETAENREDEWEWDAEHIFEALNDMKIKYDLLASEAESGYEIRKAQAISKAVDWLKNPKSMAFVSDNDFHKVHDALKRMMKEAETRRHKYIEFGVMDAGECVPLSYAVNELAGNYQYYQTEILDVLRNVNEDGYGIVHFRQGARSGYDLFKMEVLNVHKGEGKDDKAVMLECVKNGETGLLNLHNEKEFPHYSEISPALLKFYDDIRKKPPGQAFYSEDDIRRSFCGEDSGHASPKQICEEIQADIALYPGLAWAIEIDPDGKGSLDMNFRQDFRTWITDSNDGGRYERMRPIKGNIPGEEIFGQIEKALDVVAGRDPHFDGGEDDRSLREALHDFESLSGQEALVSLKHAAERPGTVKGCAVLYGTMKYETQQDRKKAYQWARKSLNKPAKEIDYEIYKKQEKVKGQGR